MGLQMPCCASHEGAASIHCYISSEARSLIKGKVDALQRSLVFVVHSRYSCEPHEPGELHFCAS